jgi:Uma2 family endonuclease
MAIAAEHLTTTQPLTLEDYLAEEEINRRYDVLDGVREFMPNPTRRYQRIQLNALIVLREFEQKFRRGQVILAPTDILITRIPLRTRQPDVLFISHEQLAKCNPPTDPMPILAAPEIVVEIISPSETRARLNAKLVDYGAIGVRECWVVEPDLRFVTRIALNASGDESQAFSSKETFQSSVWPDLQFPVEALFAE